MKNKRLITVFVFVAIAVLCCTTALAQAGEYDGSSIKGRFFLESFGVDTSAMEYDSPVSRGFASKALSNKSTLI